MSRRALRRLAHDESGFSLIELLMVMALLPIVLVAMLMTLDTVGAQTPKNVEYTQAITSASTGLQRMVREVRQAYRVNGDTPNELDFNAVINGSDLEIQYECDEPYPTNTGNPHASSYYRCLRAAVTTGGSLPSLSTGACPASLSSGQFCEVVIDRVLNGTVANPVFTFSPNGITPSYIEAQVQVPARGELASGLTHTITLDVGTEMRNLVLAS